MDNSIKLNNITIVANLLAIIINVLAGSYYWPIINVVALGFSLWSRYYSIRKYPKVKKIIADPRKAIILKALPSLQIERLDRLSDEDINDILDEISRNR